MGRTGTGKQRNPDAERKHHKVSAVRRGVHPEVDLVKLGRNLAKVLPYANHIDQSFLGARKDDFVGKVKSSIASFCLMDLLPENFNYAILVVPVRRIEKKGKAITLVKGFRKNVLLPASRNPGKVRVLDIVEKGDGTIVLEPAGYKTKFYALTSAAAFAMNAMAHQK